MLYFQSYIKLVKYIIQKKYHCYYSDVLIKILKHHILGNQMIFKGTVHQLWIKLTDILRFSHLIFLTIQFYELCKNFGNIANFLQIQCLKSTRCLYKKLFSFTLQILSRWYLNISHIPNHKWLKIIK